jgi:adenylate kinase family enzyme
MAKADKWLLDGTNPSSFDLRLPHTDLVIWVRLPRWRCFLGVYRQAARFVGTHRPDMADGCFEQWPNREFLSYIWSFERKFAPRIIQEIERHRPNVPVVTLKSHGEMAQLLDLAGLPH